LRQKPAAFRVIDSHAGAGRYDLFAAEPSRSGEWHDGIERLWAQSGETRQDAEPWPLLEPYLEAVAALNPTRSLRTYPGSPLIVQSLLRPQDRLIACELEPGSGAMLAAALRGDRRVKAIAIDGWTAIGAYLPPKERRGLVLIDPPFEDAAEFARLPEALAAAHRRWPTGIYMLWYPITVRAEPDVLARRLQRLGIAKILRCEMVLGSPPGQAGLAGSGLIVVNPPFTLEQDLKILLPTLGGILARPTSPRGDGLQAAHRVDWLAPNR
jgi:23S rRNA (adenine2030-N6)-methyltransferase